MPILIEEPTIIEAAGNKPKKIEEYAGRVNTGQTAVSVARMTSPEGWKEPGQRPLLSGSDPRSGGDPVSRARRGRFGSQSGTGRRRQSRRMGEIQHTPARRGKIHCRLHTRFLTRNREPRPRNKNQENLNDKQMRVVNFGPLDDRLSRY